MQRECGLKRRAGNAGYRVQHVFGSFLFNNLFKGVNRWCLKAFGEAEKSVFRTRLPADEIDTL